MLTPPVCVGVCPDRAFREIPAFVLVGIIYGTLMIALPGLATWLPHVLFLIDYRERYRYLGIVKSHLCGMRIDLNHLSVLDTND